MYIDKKRNPTEPPVGYKIHVECVELTKTTKQNILFV